MEIYDGQRHELTRRTLEHMVRAVSAATAERHPFPHVIIDGLFPFEIYREMLVLLPPRPLYEAFQYEKNARGGQSTRERFQLTNASIDRMSGRQRSLWLAVRDTLGSPAFRAAVFQQLRSGLAIRFGIAEDKAAGTPGYPLPELFRETSGYSIKPHPDTRKKLVTMQIALASDRTQEHLGTQFFRRSLNPAHMLREPRGFEVVKQAPFLPNTGYAFSVINNLRLKSWHGRTTLVGNTGIRNSILNIWYASAEDANPDLVKEYYRAA